MLALPLLHTACTTVQQGQAHASALAKLSPDERRLAAAGSIRTGFSKEAVLAAWGTPTEIRPGCDTGEPLDCWLYTHTFYGTGGGYYGVRRGLVYAPADGRYHYDTDDFYETPVYIRGFGQVSTEVPYKKAYFEGNRLVAFGTLTGESSYPRYLAAASGGRAGTRRR